MVIEDPFYAEPRDFLGNAAIATIMIGHFQAIQLEQLADFAHVHEGDEFAYLEVATLLHISDRAAQRRMKFARTLTARLPHTMAALKQGHIEEYKAHLISQAVECLSDEHALEVEARVLGKAARQTPTQLRNTLAKVVLAVDPEGAEERRKEKQRERRVESTPTDPGQAMLIVHHEADRIAEAHAVITGHARRLKAMGGDPRTVSQIEADVAVDLILGTGEHSGRVVEVHLTLPATTALGVDDQPGEVDGLPVTAQAARDLAAEADRWRWLKTNPLTGEVIDITSPRYTPPTALADFIKIRDRTCRFVGCTRQAYQCEIDHRVPWPQGDTCDTNCACLCKRHHRAKHEGGWTIRPIKPGWYEWTSPHGFTHTVAPDPVTEPESPPPDPDPPPPF